MGAKNSLDREGQHASKLFHTIVIVGAAFGAACGGAIETAAPSGSREASTDAPSDEFRDVGSEVGPDALEEGRSPDVYEAGERQAPLESSDDGPFDASDGDVCAQPGSNGRPCGPTGGRGFNCCNSGGCFPCFV